MNNSITSEFFEMYEKIDEVTKMKLALIGYCQAKMQFGLLFDALIKTKESNQNGKKE